jgi:ribonuclease PH
LITACCISCDTRQEKEENKVEEHKDEILESFEDAIDKSKKNLARLEGNMDSASTKARNELQSAIGKIQQQRQKVIQKAKGTGEDALKEWIKVKNESDTLLFKVDSLIHVINLSIEEI